MSQQRFTAVDKQPVVYTFFGPPGSGKGTVAREAAQAFGFKTLSTGDLLRAEIAAQSELGKKVAHTISEGKFVSDELVTEVVFNYLNTIRFESIILDGYPRTVKQAEALVSMLAAQKILLRVVHFILSDQEIINRLSVRLICENKKCQATYSQSYKQPALMGVCDLCGYLLIQREDDSLEVIQKRLKEDAQYAIPLLDYYKKNNVFIHDLHLAGLNIKMVFEQFSNICGLSERRVTCE